MPEHSFTGESHFLLGALLGALLAVPSVFLKFLRPSGGAAMVVVATAVFGVGQWQWTLPLFTFFLLSSLLTKVSPQKEQLRESFPRDAGQVSANGGVPALLSLWQFIHPDQNVYPLFVAAVCGATADTWGTEVGKWTKNDPVSILTMKTVRKGANGGVSVLGTFGAMIGSVLISATAFAWRRDVRVLFVCAGAGVFGSLVDSLAGATIQAEFVCPACGSITEDRHHCDSANAGKLKSGISIIDNDVVNWLCVISASMMAWLLHPF